MSFIYSITDDADAVTTATDVVEGTTVTADRPIYLHLLEILQTSDLGDANEEVIKIGVYRGVTAGSSGAAATENALVSSDAPTSSLTTNTWRGTASTGGTLLWIIGWNIRIPAVWCPVPEHRPKIDAGEDPYSFRLVSAPTDSLTISFTHIWEEI